MNLQMNTFSYRSLYKNINPHATVAIVSYSQRDMVIRFGLSLLWLPGIHEVLVMI